MIPLPFKALGRMPPSFRPAGAIRPYSRFDTSSFSNRDQLDKELRHLGTRSAFLQVQLANGTRDLRNDGEIRANAQTTHPGVVLTIDTRHHGTLVYPCDAFQGRSGTPSWQANLRAITLGLEALRKVERYGIATVGQQYAGFAEIGSGTPMGAGGPGKMTDTQAAMVLSDGSSGAFSADEILDGDDEAARAFRAASKIYHPDRGGDSDTFALLVAAYDHLNGVGL